jgi:hypothetical protein
MRETSRAGRPLEADEPADECVVARMRRVAVLVGEKLVEPMLGHRDGPGNLKSEATQARSPDRDKRGFRRVDPTDEVMEAALHEICAGKQRSRRVDPHAGNRTESVS